MNAKVKDIENYLTERAIFGDFFFVFQTKSDMETSETSAG